MTQDQVDPNVQLRAMVSIRGLSDGDNRIPVRRFQGSLLTVAPRQTTYQGTATTRVDLKFNDAIIMETLEPYPYDTVELSIKLSDRKNSSWGIFGQTLADRIPADKDIYDCIGSRFEMVIVPHQFGYAKDKFHPDPAGTMDPNTNEVQQLPDPIIADCWEVASIRMDGAGIPDSEGSGAIEAALRILDGKSEADFNKEVWTDQTVKSDPSMSSMLLARSFIPAMIDAGRISKDDAGIFHLEKVAAS